MAPPVPTTAGGCWAEIGPVLFRCHGWVDGSAKENEETSPPEARAMGRIVAQLHGLAVPCSLARERNVSMDADRWMRLAAAGRGRHTGWANRIVEQVESLARIAAGPTPVELGGDELVGSHRDLNAHNVLFSEAGLHLVDWDSQGSGRSRVLSLSLSRCLVSVVVRLAQWPQPGHGGRSERVAADQVEVAAAQR
jgi:Ser/Thr protein kinase RdoA (MazF antagonist)